ncbi:MAG: TraR/DksA C4-type zinc finger protein [Nitrospirae bacterium]|uniref:FmdE family protein n=1 Tax=Candidatus Magnetobacterium casense TaxID=1455061 RepID=UPI00058B89EE|nr:FmdE family protein [Candidatus Magnetobacterium casensis]MBF0338460.1 TraR/DksA C4-type zinc finger protein [Nitrospirota bacterium]
MAYNFDLLLTESARIHGHLCAGQVLGVRMSILGLTLIGIEDPKGRDRKNLLVYVEIDRCATDAITSVTGCSLGHRTLKYVDYGKMAATFLNLTTGRAIRVLALEEARDIAKSRFPHIDDQMQAQCEAYKVMADEELFRWMEVSLSVRQEDMPGKPLRRVVCSACGEHVSDAREGVVDGKVLCRACQNGAYYTLAGQRQA